MSENSPVPPPINWFSWEPDAFQEAADKNQMVFVSVDHTDFTGSRDRLHPDFVDTDINAILQEYFVCIHVPAKQRPDLCEMFGIFLKGIEHLATLDEAALQDSSFATATFERPDVRAGFKPRPHRLLIWLTPDAKPVFGTARFCESNSHDQPGLMTLLERCLELWVTQLPLVLAQSEALFEPWQSACAACSQGVNNS